MGREALGSAGAEVGAFMGRGVARAALAPIRSFTSGTERIASEGDVSQRMDRHAQCCPILSWTG